MVAAQAKGAALAILHRMARTALFAVKTRTKKGLVWIDALKSGLVLGMGDV